MDESLFKKMSLKEGMTLCAINPTEEFGQFLAVQKTIAIVKGNADFVLAFVRERAQLPQLMRDAKQARKEGGKIWLAYPKATSAFKPDINRDSLFGLTPSFGLIINGNFALDDNWSLLRTKDL
jgi:hypothetical protein